MAARHTGLVLLAALATGCLPANPSPAAETVTLYVRVQSTREAWVAVSPASDTPPIEGQGFPPGTAVGCLKVPVRSSVVLTDGAPQTLGTKVLQVIHQNDGSGSTQTLWADVPADGAAITGVGLPDWWTSVPQACP